jgi:hypothetical protein
VVSGGRGRAAVQVVVVMVVMLVAVVEVVVAMVMSDPPPPPTTHTHTHARARDMLDTYISCKLAGVLSPLSFRRGRTRHALANRLFRPAHLSRVVNWLSGCACVECVVSVNVDCDVVRDTRHPRTMCVWNHTTTRSMVVRARATAARQLSKTIQWGGSL